MSSAKILFVGGCKASYHLLEPAVAPVTSALAEIGMHVDATGIYHPDSPEAPVGDYSALNAANLAQYDALVLFTTSNGCGEDIDAVLDFVRRGKPLIGIHCAADSFTDRDDYIAALGGRFRTHPAPLDVTVDIVDPSHQITHGLTSFTVHDELYLFRDYDASRVHLLAQTTTLEDDGPIPIAWTREEGAGRVFYMSLGHFPHVMEDGNWRILLQRGVLWGLGRSGR